MCLNKTKYGWVSLKYRVSSNKRRASNKRRRLMSAALLSIHNEVSPSL